MLRGSFYADLGGLFYFNPEKGSPRNPQSGFRGERRSNEMSELFRLRRSEGYEVCDDAARYEHLTKLVELYK